jgi:hypothetical protein
MKAGAVNDDPSLEKEADMMGEKAAQIEGDHEARNLVAEECVAGAVTQRVAGFNNSVQLRQLKTMQAMADQSSEKVIQAVWEEGANPLVPNARFVDWDSGDTYDPITRQLVNGNTQDRQVLSRDDHLVMLRQINHDIWGIHDTIGANYKIIIDALDEVHDQVPQSQSERVRRTIRAAALIDANSHFIAGFGADAREAVNQLVQDTPSSGFANESSNAILERARVVLSAWDGAVGAAAQLELFNSGFGNDPCLAARLNGILEFRAGQLGITEEALAGAVYDIELGGRILNLMYEHVNDNHPQWDAFMTYLNDNHQDIVTNPNFHTTYPKAKEGFT